MEIVPARFQSTHPRGVRLTTTPLAQLLTNFNPRTHVGCDLDFQGNGRHPGNFNPRTHVGCDEDSAHTKAELWDFNPRTHVGCDLLKSSTEFVPFLFQSTHPRGVRPTGGRLQARGRAISIHAPTWGATQPTARRSPSPWHFNPRTHVGCDLRISAAATLTFYFNPRTHVGCDPASRTAPV